MLEKTFPAVTYMLALFFFLLKLPLFCLLVDMFVSSKEVILSTRILKYLKVWSMHRNNYERARDVSLGNAQVCSTTKRVIFHVSILFVGGKRVPWKVIMENLILIPASIISFKSRKKAFLLLLSVCDFPALLFFTYRVYDRKFVLPQGAFCGAKRLVKWCLSEVFLGVPHHFAGFCSLPFFPSGSRS